MYSLWLLFSISSAIPLRQSTAHPVGLTSLDAVDDAHNDGVNMRAESQGATDSIDNEATTSKAVMVANGWTFKFTNDDGRSAAVQKQCGKGATWFGWSSGTKVGTLKRVIAGDSTAELLYKNCWYAGTVNVYVNGKLKDYAGPKQDGRVTLDFKDGDVLEIKDEGKNSVIQIQSFKFIEPESCTLLDLEKQSNYQVSSPMDRTHYPRLSDKCWRIEAPADKKIQITFKKFDLEFFPRNCSFDNVTIHDGADTNSPRIALLCGNSKNMHYSSSSNHMRVEFHSDALVQRSGFSASIGIESSLDEGISVKKTIK